MDIITIVVLIGAVAVTIVGPLVLAAAGLRSHPGQDMPKGPVKTADGSKRLVGSLLLSALAFNLMFLFQELGLVIPKAMTPGLQPVLYHNNHDWTGDNPLAELLQGTGALAIFILSLALFGLVRWLQPRGFLVRSFLLWLVFHGFFQSVPQVVVGSILPGNDVGRAMTWLAMSPPLKLLAAFVAMALIVWFGLTLRRDFLELASNDAQIATPRARMTFILRSATLPLAASLPLIFMSREPGSIDQVYIVPVAVAIIGIGWIQGGAWAEQRATAQAARPVSNIFLPAAGLIVLFSFFHIVLAPGVPFD